MQLYDRAELFASFSFDEGFGIPVLEALSFGCKLALSDIPAYKELFAGVASFAEPSNVKSCAEILKIAISQPAADKTNAKHLFTKYDYAQSSSTLAKLVEENF